MMAAGVDGTAWKSQRCSEYSISCHSNTPAAASPPASCGGVPPASAFQASRAATGSHNNGTAHLRRMRQQGMGQAARPSSGG